MADYPAGIYAPRTKTNRSGVVYDAAKETVLFAEDVVKDDDEIVAIETELGTNPKGAKADVKTRLDDVDTALGTIPVKATGTEINTGTNDAKFATPLAIADSNIAFIADVPVKATGAEINTGTDDAKFATAKAVADSNISFPAKTETLTNKRITPRVSSEASSATPTINTDTADCHSITALAVAITSFTTNLSGTPTNFQKLIIRIKDNATARAIAWGASFVALGVALPTTTVISKELTVGFIYDTVSAKWGCVASAQEA